MRALRLPAYLTDLDGPILFRFTQKTLVVDSATYIQRNRNVALPRNRYGTLLKPTRNVTALFITRSAMRVNRWFFEPLIRCT